MLLNSPTQLALIFCDHLDAGVAAARSRSDLTAPVRRLIGELERRYNIPVTLGDCGVYFENLMDLNQ